MDKSVVSAESEMRANYNKILEYEDYLVRMIGQFNQMLAAIQNGPVQDELICAKLSLLSEELKPFIQELEDSVGTQGYDAVKSDMSEIAAADNFRFPGLGLAKVSSLLASFL